MWLFFAHPCHGSCSPPCCFTNFSPETLTFTRWQRNTSANKWANLTFWCIQKGRNTSQMVATFGNNKGFCSINSLFWGWHFFAGGKNAHLQNPWSYNMLPRPTGPLGAEPLSYSELVKPSRTTNKSCVQLMPPETKPSRPETYFSPKTTVISFCRQKMRKKQNNTKRILSHSGVVPRLKRLSEAQRFDWHYFPQKGQSNKYFFFFKVSVLKSSLFSREVIPPEFQILRF